jgi:hypothetical protein
MDEAVLAKILEAQYFITHQLQTLSDNLFTQFGWNQRRGDWGADLYHLAAYIGTRRWVLSFTFEELMEDHGSPEWERMLSDKIIWFIDQVSSENPVGPGIPGQEKPVRPEQHLTALEVLQNADFNYTSSTHKWRVCGRKQVVYVVVTCSLSVDEAAQCMKELWGAFISLKRQYVKVYAVLDLNRMDSRWRGIRRCSGGWRSGSLRCWNRSGWTKVHLPNLVRRTGC